MNQIFQDRFQAGQLLVERLKQYANRDDVLVLALPRGGVPVGFEVALKLNAPLDVFVVRKLGMPGHPELAIGAIASGGVRVLNDEVVYQLDIPKRIVDSVAFDEERELRRRELAYRGHGESPTVAGKTVILVDDGIATGSTMRAAIRALRHQNVARLVVAAPVAAFSSADEIRRQVDQFIAVLVPQDFGAVSQWYQNFNQTTDAEVTALLDEARQQHHAAATTH
jgi:putative phosphoribosyl transferase